MCLAILCRTFARGATFKKVEFNLSTRSSYSAFAGIVILACYLDHHTVHSLASSSWHVIELTAWHGCLLLRHTCCAGARLVQLPLHETQREYTRNLFSATVFSTYVDLCTYVYRT